MKYYTKEWYALMQKQHYTGGLTVIPDKKYSDAEIKAFFEHDLQAEIDHDRRIHYGKEPFDPTDTIDCFKECYRMLVRHGWKQYPEWVNESVDKRLLAMNRITESAYNRLFEEEKANRKAFEQIMTEAAAALKAQDIPDKLRDMFRFHDANVLSLKRVGVNIEMLLRDGGFIGGTTLYSKLTFRNVRSVDREKGFALRPRLDQHGEYSSGCMYLYDELYRVENGYEIHMLLWTRKALRYLTIACEDIVFEDSIQLSL